MGETLSLIIASIIFIVVTFGMLLVAYGLWRIKE